MSKELEYVEELKLRYKEENGTVRRLNAIEKELKEKETQDSVIKTLKEIIEFDKTLPQIKPNKDNGFDMISTIGINVQRDIENKERELLRKWVLDTCFPKEPKESKAFEVIKKKKILSVWSYENKYFILSNAAIVEISKEEYDLLKEELK